MSFYHYQPTLHPIQLDRRLIVMAPSNNVQLHIRQEPEKAQVAQENKEKSMSAFAYTFQQHVRKPIDPPPIVQMVLAENVDPNDEWLVSPYLFMMVTLLEGEHGETAMAGKTLIGQLVSSLHRLKDIDNSDGGFFVFGDISVMKMGWFRLRFSLFDLEKETSGDIKFIKSIDSKSFQVYQSKDFPGMGESTTLSRTFADQGVRLRVRKDTRSSYKRALRDTSQDAHYGHGYGGYNDVYAAPQPKRQRHSIAAYPGTNDYSRLQGLPPGQYPDEQYDNTYTYASTPVTNGSLPQYPGMGGAGGGYTPQHAYAPYQMTPITTTSSQTTSSREYDTALHTPRTLSAQQFATQVPIFGGTPATSYQHGLLGIDITNPLQPSSQPHMGPNPHPAQLLPEATSSLPSISLPASSELYALHHALPTLLETHSQPIFGIDGAQPQQLPPHTQHPAYINQPYALNFGRDHPNFAPGLR